MIDICKAIPSQRFNQIGLVLFENVNAEELRKLSLFRTRKQAINHYQRKLEEIKETRTLYSRL